MLPEQGHQLLLLGCQFLSHGANIDKKNLTPNFFRSIPYFFRSFFGNRPFLCHFAFSRGSVTIPHIHKPQPRLSWRQTKTVFSMGHCCLSLLVIYPILPLFLFLFPLVTLPCSPLPCTHVQVSYVHHSVPLVAFLCTSLSGKGRFRPFSERLVHNITTTGTFCCTSQTCT